MLLPLTLINLVWSATPARGRTFPRLLLPLAVLVASATWLLSFAGAWFFAVAAVTAVLVTGVRVAWRRGRGSQLIHQLLRRVGTLSVCALLVLAVAVQTPWMSHERVSTTDGPVTGYIVDDEPGFVKVLTENRDIIIDTADVTGRELLD